VPQTAHIGNLGDFTSVLQKRAAGAILDKRDPATPRSWSSLELARVSDNLARGLLAEGRRRGDRVAILAENSAEYLIAVSGLMKAGLTAVPVNLWLPQQTVDYILRDCDSQAVFVDRDRPSLAVPSLPKYYLHGSAEEQSLAKLVRQGAANPNASGLLRAVQPDDIAYILYTSGSTGRPKGVLLPHHGQIWTLQKFLPMFQQHAGAQTLMVAPYYHMNGLFISMLCLGSGVGLVVQPRFSARPYIQALQEHRCAILSGIPAMFAMIARETELLRGADFSYVRQIFLGSSPLTDKLLNQMQALFPGAKITNSFGTTEAGPYVFGPHPQGLPAPALSLGFPAPGVEVELVDGLGPDTGTLRLRSPAVMRGYLNLPEQTAERLHDGWYCTGDVMHRDSNGFFHYLGRADDMFVCGGENIYPGEIEGMLEKHPRIAQAVVVPAADDIKGQIPVAFVVCAPDSTLTPADVRAYALEQGPAYSHPRYVRILERLPVTAAHKYDRRALAQQAAQIVAAARGAQ